ncbi:ATP-binding protein [Bacillus cereus]
MATDLSQTMEKLIGKKIHLTSNLCQVCLNKGIKQNTMIHEKAEVCPKCSLQKYHDQLQDECNQYYQGVEERKRKEFFYQNSIIEDPTIVDATFENFIPECEEEKENKAKAWRYTEEFIAGHNRTILLAGESGRGKSHLSHAIAHKTNEEGSGTVLYVSCHFLFKKIRSTFRKDSELSEEDILQMIIKSDMVVFDDFGCSLGDYRDVNQLALWFHQSNGQGDITKLIRASKFENDVWGSILDGRQKKKNVFVTNLTGPAIRYGYDPRVASRLLRVHADDIMQFKHTPDRRRKEFLF